MAPLADADPRPRPVPRAAPRVELRAGCALCGGGCTTFTRHGGGCDARSHRHAPQAGASHLGLVLVGDHHRRHLCGRGAPVLLGGGGHSDVCPSHPLGNGPLLHGRRLLENELLLPRSSRVVRLHLCRLPCLVPPRVAGAARAPPPGTCPRSAHDHRWRAAAWHLTALAAPLRLALWDCVGHAAALRDCTGAISQPGGRVWRLLLHTALSCNARGMGRGDCKERCSTLYAG
mmetsp:Transcript_50371/g.116275  ORF Transcript_50371/g.116275 Transcript_50371/m.116275 type:complete len:231 (-) Transcript_50371:1168-1860(-)